MRPTQSKCNVIKSLASLCLAGRRVRDDFEPPSDSSTTSVGRPKYPQRSEERRGVRNRETRSDFHRQQLHDQVAHRESAFQRQRFEII